MNNNHIRIFIGVTGIVLIFAFFIVLLRIFGFFNFTGADASAKLVASTIALVSGLIGSLVTIIGIFLKNSLDQRNANLKEEAEGRLKLEAGLQAIKLLSPGSGTVVSLTQRAGVLFTLAHLKQSDLAITMLGQMLPKGSIDAKTAAWLINHVLESYLKDLKNRSLKGLSIEATRLLDENYDKFLVAKGYYEFPRCMNLNWNTELPKFAKRNAALALLRMTVNRRCTKWNFGAMNLVIASLILKWKNETDDEIRNGVGKNLKIIIELRAGYTLHLPSGKMNVNEVIFELEKIAHFPTTTEFDNLSELMKKWIYCGKGCAKIKCARKCGELGQHSGKHKCDSCGHEW